MLSAIKKMNMDNFSSAWKNGPTCEGCSIKFHVFRKKRPCYFCKYYFCNLCILRRPDKKFCCRKCQILTARPLDKDDLLNLGSRDLKNYLTSRHIPTNGCLEKEDLVNVLMRAVNNSSFHASSSTHSDVSSCTNSYPNSPHRSPPFQDNLSNSKRKLAQSEENLSSHDGIRITGTEASDDAMDEASFEIIDPITLEGAASNAEWSDITPENYSNCVVDDSSQQNAEAVNDNQDDNTAINESVAVIEEIDAQEVESVPDASISRPLMLSDITSLADLEALSVKQLKELLMRNRTDFKGCIERAELIEKANRLWSDYTISRKDMEKLSLDELCKICMDAPIECVFLECGHMATCTSCGKQLCECPICRQFVVRCVRTFKA